MRPSNILAQFVFPFSWEENARPVISIRVLTLFSLCLKN